MEHKEAKNQSEQEEKNNQKKKKHKDTIRSLWVSFKKSNIHIIGLPEGKEEEQEIGDLFEKIMKENFLNLVKEIDI